MVRTIHEIRYAHDERRRLIACRTGDRPTFGSWGQRWAPTCPTGTSRTSVFIHNSHWTKVSLQSPNLAPRSSHQSSHYAAMVISEHSQGLLHLADPARVSCETPVKKPSKSTRIFNGHVSKLAYTFLPHLPVFRVGSPVGSHFFYRISAFPGDSPAPPLESGSKRTHNIAANFPRSDSSGGAGEITGWWRRKVYANFETRPLKILVDFAYSRELPGDCSESP